MAESNALITVPATASVEDILTEARQSGASSVDVLLPNGAPALQSRKTCDRLRELANRAGIELTLYTDDDAIISAAQKCQIMVVPVDPSALASIAAPAAASPPPAAPAAPASPPEARPTLSSAEEDFLRSLDSVPEISPPAQPGNAAWDALAAETLAPAPEAASPPPAASSTLDEDMAWFDSFNDFGDVSAAEAEAAARPRVRPEDIELSDADLHRQTKKGRREAQDQRNRDARDKSTGKSREGRGSKRTDGKPRDGRSRDGKRDKAAPTSKLPLVLGFVALLVLAALIWFLFFRSSGVTVSVRAPVKNGQVFQNITINFQAEPVTDPTSAAVQGRVITLAARAEMTGTVQQETGVPDQTARGVLTIYNRLTQDLPIPAGTALTTTNLDGQPVQYRTTSDIVLPAAAVTFNGTQNGVADVPIEATTGGTAHNLPPRSDDATLWSVGDIGDSVFAVNTVAIEGGTVRMERIPTQADINALLPQAIPLLVNNAVQQLQGKLQPGEQLLNAELTPRTEELASNPELYQVSTEPLPDVDGGFRLVVTANFTTLAFQGSIDSELRERALPNALSLTNGFQKEASQVVSYTLKPRDSTASILIADVGTAPKGQEGQLAPTVVERLKADLSTKTLVEANAVLADYINRQEISGFDPLTAIDSMPDAESITIKVVP